MEIITGEKFLKDKDLMLQIQLFEGDEKLTNIKNNYGNVKNFLKKSEKNLYMMTTEFVDIFFQNPPEEKFILITHNSDGSIIDENGRRGCENCGQEYCANINNIPKNLVKWYGINKTVYHEKIESIPIGIENTRFDIGIDREEILNRVRNQKKISKKLLYINHFWRHNPNERIEPFELFNNKQWVTCVNAGSSLNGVRYEEFLNELNSHNFILCPEGVGPDTYRVWESLYLGAIPIIKRKKFSEYYSDLPVCYVDNWQEINENFLMSEIDRIKKGTYNLEKLDYNYWKTKILEELKKLSDE